MKKILLSVLLLALVPAALAAEIDPFYQSLLREGTQQYDRGDFAEASRTLRLACFGMLDEPPVLGGCLMRLALAQDRAGDDDGFADTFRRLSEVEERFQAYTRAEGVSAELRTALELRLVARIPAATLRSIPAFQALSARKPEARPAAPGAKETKETKADKARESPAVTGPPSTTIVPPAPLAALPTADRDRMARARKILDQETRAPELRQAFDLARQVADAHPKVVEAQHLAAEAAYRVSLWQEAAKYFRRGGVPPDDQPELLFYMAVALFESGDQAGAAAALKRSLPNLERTPYVDAYARKILG